MLGDALTIRSARLIQVTEPDQSHSGGISAGLAGWIVRGSMQRFVNEFTQVVATAASGTRRVRYGQVVGTRVLLFDFAGADRLLQAPRKASIGVAYAWCKVIFWRSFGVSRGRS